MLRRNKPTLLFATLLSFHFFLILGAPRLFADEPGTSVPLLGNQHVESLDTPHIPYNSNPPTSGPHLPFLAPWGVHHSPIPKELQVHNLEDGGVVIQYNCMHCPELIQKLEQLVQGYQQQAEMEKKKNGFTRHEHVLLAPYPNMDAAIALTAWGRIDKFNQYDEKRIKRFIEAYIGIDHHPGRE
jgi:hypothetical protein